jgi:transposase
MAPQSETEFQNLSREELIASGINYFRLFRSAEETVRRLEKIVETLSNEVGSQKQTLLWSQDYLAQLKRLKFGPSSERRREEGGPLFESAPGAKEKEGEWVKKKKRTQFGRKEQKELLVIPRLYELSEEEQKQQGLRPMKGQFEESEQVQVSPSQFFLEKIQRQKYCSNNSLEPRIVTAPGPVKLKEGGRYSLEFAVEVGVDKYQHHLPIERQVTKMKSDGLIVESQTLFSQIDTVHWYLKPHLIEPFIKQSETQKVHLSDETPWGNLSKKGSKRFTLWGMRNEKCTLFEIYDSRSQQVAKNFLGNIEGVLVTDGYAAYRALQSPKLQLANDWYHVRRKMINAEKNFKEESKFFIRKIRFLSRIEKNIEGKSREERLRTRQKKSKLLVDAIKKKLDELHKTLPQSSLGKAISYTQKLWPGLTLFLDNPDVPFHTNDIEREIRGPVIGRKNHYGSHSLKSAEIASTWYSVIATCKQHGIDPKAYITDTLHKILAQQKILMPWEWVKP